MAKRSAVQPFIIAIIVVALAVIAYAVLTAPDRRSTTDRIGDAFHALPQGIGAASRQMEDRTPGQKLGDKIEDAGHEVKEDTRY